MTAHAADLALRTIHSLGCCAMHWMTYSDRLPRNGASNKKSRTGSAARTVAARCLFGIFYCRAAARAYDPAHSTPPFFLAVSIGLSFFLTLSSYCLLLPLFQRDAARKEKEKERRVARPRVLCVPRSPVSRFYTVQKRETKKLLQQKASEPAKTGSPHGQPGHPR